MTIFWSERRQRYIIRIEHGGKREERSALHKATARLIESDFINRREQAKLRGRKLGEDKKLSFLCKEYLSKHVPLKRSQKDLTHHIKIIKEHLGSIPAMEISRSDVSEFAHNLLQKGLSHARVNRYLATISSIYSFSLEEDLVPFHPLRRLRKLPERPPKRTHLTHDQYKELLQSCSPWLRPIIEVAVGTAMRQGEILNMTWQDIDMRGSTIEIRQYKGQKKPESKIVYIPPPTLTVLKSLKNGDTKGLVFSDEKGQPLSRNGKLRSQWEAVLKKVGLEKLRFHDLRHTAASWMLEQTKNPETVKKQLGHSTLRMTEKYMHYGDEQMKRDMVQYGKALKSEGS